MLTKKSLVLAGVAVLMGALTLVEPGGPANEVLPVLSGVERESVTRIEITTGQIKKTVISGTWDEGYSVLQPYEGPADFMSLRPVMNAFVDPIAMDLRVDEGDLESYGVDDQSGVLVELFTDRETPAMSVVIGYDVPGGSSFVRLPGSDEVFRAKVGGRARYEHDPIHWKDRMVAEWEADEMVSITTDAGAFGSWKFVRTASGVDAMGQPELGDWSAVGGPEDLEPDQAAITALVKSLCVLRSGRILSADYDGGWDPPGAVVTMVDLDGQAHTLTFGSVAFDGAAWVKTPEREEVFQVAAADRGRVLKDWDDFRDLTVFAFSRHDIKSIRLEDGGLPVLVAQHDDGMWSILEPPNMDTDVKQVTFTANTLANLRGQALLDPSVVPFGELTNRFTITFEDNSTKVLEFGTPWIENGRRHFPMRVQGRPELYRYAESSLEHLRTGIGRG